MPPRSKVEQLPVEIKQWLDEKLIAGNFAGYEALEDAINARLAGAGADWKVGKSSLHRYGSKFEDKVKTLKIVSEQARAIVEADGDSEDAVSQALIRMTQEKAFNILMEMEIDPGSVDFTKLTRAIADISRASLGNKKYAAEVKSRASAAAESVAKTMRKAGLTADTVDTIRREILGIA